MAGNAGPNDETFRLHHATPTMWFFAELLRHRRAAAVDQAAIELVTKRAVTLRFCILPLTAARSSFGRMVEGLYMTSPGIADGASQHLPLSIPSRMLLVDHAADGPVHSQGVIARPYAVIQPAGRDIHGEAHRWPRLFGIRPFSGQRERQPIHLASAVVVHARKPKLSSRHVARGLISPACPSNRRSAVVLVEVSGSPSSLRSEVDRPGDVLSVVVYRWQHFYQERAASSMILSITAGIMNTETSVALTIS